MKLIKWIDWKTAQQYENSEVDCAVDLEENIEFFAELITDENRESIQRVIDSLEEKRAQRVCEPEQVKTFRKFKNKAWHLTVQYMKKYKLQFSGSYHQHGSNGVPLFDNGFVLCLSQRAWGSVMAEVCDVEGTMAYCAWAWTSPEGEDEKYPDMIENSEG